MSRRTGVDFRTTPIDQRPGTPGGWRGGGGQSGRGAFPDSGSDGPLGLGAMMAVPSPDVVKPPDGQNFNRYVEGSFGPGPVTTLLIAGALGVTRGTSLLSLPVNTVGVIREVTFGVIAMNAGTIIEFRLASSGSPVEGYSPFPIFPGALVRFSATLPPEDTFVPLPDGKDVTWTVAVTDGGTYQLSVQYRGWFYPKQLATEYAAMLRAGRG